jgi:acetamidase/formamidase
MKLLDGTQPENLHFMWRPGIEPVLTVEPDERFQVVIPDSSTGQIRPGFSVSDLDTVDESKYDGAVGPVYVRGAEPGDTAEIVIENITTGQWGWTAILRNFGLFKETFEPTLVTWDIGLHYATPRGEFLRGVRIPVRPFLGVVGCAPAIGEYDMIPPRHFGGNMDNRLLRKGARLLLPITNEGALVSFADPHASQGDGEVCGTAIETSAVITARIRLRKGFARTTPMLVSHEEDSGLKLITMGISDNLYEGAKLAVSEMIDHLKTQGFTKEEAYVLCSVAGNLRISEIVDEPNYVVSFVLPEELTTRR